MGPPRGGSGRDEGLVTVPAKGESGLDIKVFTIGAYGFDETSFFQALADAGVDTFCDIRLRRGMRGRRYAFANSQRLQERLSELGIRYLHVKELAPSQQTRALQRREDETLRVRKHERTMLGSKFVEGYRKQCLSGFRATEFVQRLGLEAVAVVFFCVERDPEACHRSLVAEAFARDLQTEVVHIRP